VPPEARFSARVTHAGLSGRSLASSTTSRHVTRAVARDTKAEVEIVVTLGSARDTLVDDVRRITEPMFMLFNFTQFERPIYADIVGRFEKGKVS
jgi:hypothetical protein